MRIAVVLLACACGRNDPAGGTEQKVTCDGQGPQKRERWLLAKQGDGFSPHDKGFRASGTCMTELHDTQLDCALDKLERVIGDSPYLRQARDEGFQMYVCVTAGASESRTRYSFGDVVAR